jgi:hypothetical protein
MIQKINYNKENRVETGAVQFGNDWPGLFIRGDDCIFLSESLKFKLDPEHYRPNDILDFSTMNFLRHIIVEIDNNVLQHLDKNQE